MTRTILLLAMLCMTALLALAPTASADSGLKDCVWVENGDPVSVNVSPGTCYEKGRPVWNAWNEQCNWIAENPIWGGGLQCAPL